MDYLLTVLLLPFIFIITYLFFTWNYDYWKKKGIPSKEGKIPFGNIRDIFLLKKTMNQQYTEIYKEFHNKPLVGFYKMRTPILMVRDPELVQAVLVKDFSSFHDNDFHFDSKKDPILALNPFCITGERWKSIRNIAIHGLTPSKLKGMVPLVNVVSIDMIKYIEDHEMSPLEAKYLVGNFTADVSASCGFGVQINSFKDPDGEFRIMSNRVLNGEFLSNLALLSSFYVPRLAKLMNIRLIPKSVNDYFIQVVSDLVKYRQREGVSRNDYLQMLINDNSESEKKGQGTLYSYNDMAGHCMTFYLDGYNTSSIVSSFALYEMAKHPEVQENVRDEIFSVINSFEEIDYQKLQELTYMDLILKETLRMHPPVPTINRLCTKSTVISYKGRDYAIEKGTTVTVPVHALHMDPKHFSEPEKFIPERFQDDEKIKTSYTYLPFGEGPRICLGVRLGLMNVKLALVAILMNFEFSPNDPSFKIEEDPKNSFIYTPKGGLWLKFKKLKRTGKNS